MRRFFQLIAAVLMVTLMVVTGCQRDVDLLEPAAFPTDPEVFLDGFTSDLGYQAFGGSKVDALEIDDSEFYSGTSSLKFTVPNEGDPAGSYAGGAFTSSVGRDLSGYDALTFRAKASRSVSLDVAGLGNDNTGTSKFVAQTSFALTTSWRKYILPIPLASKHTVEKGLFFVSEGPENSVGCEMWFDEVQFEKLGTIAQARPTIATQTVNTQVGKIINISGTAVTFNVAGTDQTVAASPGYFTFFASNDTVVTVTEDGTITTKGLGSATITAKLGSLDAVGAVTVNVNESAPGPATPAPTPTVAASDVISLFSNAYTNVPVDTWSAGFGIADFEDTQIAGDDVKLYTNLVFAGVEFISQTVNAAAMNRFHMDIWTPDPTAAPAAFRIKLVDFGADNAFGGGDDSEHEITVNAASTPPLSSNNWVGIDVPLSAFTGLAARSNLAQMIISGDPNTVYVDNVYFYNGGGGGGGDVPTTPAPTPAVPASDVISLFSNAYSNVLVDTWSAGFDLADLEDIQISGDDVKKYTNLVFAGVEFTSQTIDATAMTHFNMDIWTPDPTALPAVFKVKLVDFGADGVFGGGDDVEHEVTLDATTTPALTTGNWAQLSIPLTAFTGLITREHVAQLIFSGDPNTVYVDNVYFYIGGGSSGEPTTAAPTPAFPAADVISLFSNAYSNVAVDTWSAVWDVADVADVQIAGNDTKLYTNVVFSGIEFINQTVDGTAMTHFYLNLWTPDPTAAPAIFKVKLVDFGADGMFDGGDDVEHEITLNATTIPGLSTGSWLEMDIPLSQFTGLTTTGHLAQLIFSGDLATFYLDNVLFHK